MPSPSSGAIRAGAAFVEIFVDHNPLARGLKAAGDKLKSFGSFADGLVAKAAGLAGLVATPVLGALKEFTDLGKELVHGSERIGTTVEQLDAMRYAAEQAGVGADELEGAAARLNRTAAQAPDKLERLGVSAKEFADLSLEEKFRAVAQGVADLKDDTQRTAAVMDIFGRSGARLLPMFKDGAEGISKATEEAKRLGLVMSGEDAQKAAELGKAFDRLKAVIHRTFVQLGAALLPVFEKIKAAIDEKIGNLQTLQVLIRNNTGLITSFLQVAKVVLKVAAAWLAFRFAMTQVGNVLSLASMGLSAVGAVLGFLLSPLGLVLLAVGGLTALFLTQTDAGRKFAADLLAAFGGLGDRFREVWGGIKDALRAGDLGLAARIAWLGVQREAMRVWQVLRLAWTDVIDFFGDGWDSLIALLEDGWNAFGDFFEDAGLELAKALSEPMLDAIKLIQDNTRELRAWLERRGISTFKDLDTEAIKKALPAAFAAVDKANTKERLNRDKDLTDELERKRADREEARGDLKDDLDKQINEIEARLREALREAKDKNAQVITGAVAPGGRGLANLPAAVLAASAKGTFGGSRAAGALAYGDAIAAKQLAEQQRTNELLEDIDSKAGGLAFGQ